MQRAAHIARHMVESAAAAATVERPTDWPEDIPVPTYHRSPRFAVGDPASYKYFDDEGYVVYKDVLDASEVQETLSKQWDFMEALGAGVDRHDPTTWDHQQWYPGGPGSGIMGNFGVGQCDAMWYVRAKPKVKQVFAELYGTDELLTSFDGMCLFRPTGLNPEWATNGNSWFHTDRSPYPDIDQRKYIQGLVNIVKTTPEGGGNVIVRRSHKLYKELVEKYGQGEGERRSMDVQRVRKERPELFADAIYTHLEAGDVFLWDDRTLHCNAPGVGPAPATSELLRSCCYVCMTPKSNATPEVIAGRRRAVELGWGTGHTSHTQVQFLGRSPTVPAPLHLLTEDELRPTLKMMNPQMLGNDKLTPEQIDGMGKERMLEIIKNSEMWRRQGNSEQARYKCGAKPIETFTPEQLDLIG